MKTIIRALEVVTKLDPDDVDAEKSLARLKVAHSQSFAAFEERHYQALCNSLSSIATSFKQQTPDEYLEGGLWMHDEVGQSSSVQRRECFVNAFASFPSTRPQRLAEIGFNAGHSSAMLLSVLPGTSLVSFDLCEHGYTSAAHAHLKLTFPGRHELVCGDSLLTVPTFAHRIGNASHHEEPFDAFFVDGRHTTQHAAGDIRNARALSRRGGLVVVDDCDNLEVERAWAEVVEEGLVEPHLPGVCWVGLCIGWFR